MRVARFALEDWVAVEDGCGVVATVDDGWGAADTCVTVAGVAMEVAEVGVMEVVMRTLLLLTGTSWYVSPC